MNDKKEEEVLVSTFFLSEEEKRNLGGTDAEPIVEAEYIIKLEPKAKPEPEESENLYSKEEIDELSNWLTDNEHIEGTCWKCYFNNFKHVELMEIFIYPAERFFYHSCLTGKIISVA